MRLPGIVFRSFLFSNLFIACCAVLMTAQTFQLLMPRVLDPHLFGFIFFATICSYSFHWWLTTDQDLASIRGRWQRSNPWIHPFLFVPGALGSAWFGLKLIGHWPWLLFVAFVTFLYSAPKIPLPPFRWLRRIALGKTFFLTIVWTFVTSVLPLVIDGGPWSTRYTLFVAARFTLIYPICILFDLRDRDYDRKHGVRSLTTFLSLGWIRFLFYLSILLFVICSMAQLAFGQSPATVFFLLIPGVITAIIYKKAIANRSDLLFYFILDGLMALSSLLTLTFMPWFALNAG